MNKSEYAQQEKEHGRKVVYANGVWWCRAAQFFFMPLHVVEPLDGINVPPMSNSFLGFQHVVKHERHANSRLPVLAADPKRYDMARLTLKKRNRIRKGLGNLEIRPVVDRSDMIDRAFEINHSAMQRQDRKSDFSHYTDRRKWTAYVDATLGANDRETLGAYRDGLLVAYLSTVQLEDTLYFYRTQSHSDFLCLVPNEALYHVCMERARENPSVRLVVSGFECAKESLNEFKRALGFESVSFPTYRWINPVVRPLVRFTRYAHYL